METKELIKLYCDFTDEELREMFFNTACEYVENMYGITETGRLNGYFWNWWANTWSIIDEQFIDNLKISDNGQLYFQSGNRTMGLFTTEHIRNLYISEHTTGRMYMSKDIVRLTGIKQLITTC